MKKPPVKRNPMFVLYPIADFIITAGIFLLSFLTIPGSVSITPTNAWAIGIFIGADALCVVIAFIIARIYSILTRNFGFVEALKISIVQLIVQLLFLIPLMLLPGEILPRMSLWVWGLAVIALCFIIPSTRLIQRLNALLEHMKDNKSRVKTLIIGTGTSAKMVIDSTRNHKTSNNNVVVLATDDVELIGKSLSNIPVRGPLSNLPTIIDKYGIQEVIFAKSSMDEKYMRQVIEYLEPCPVRVKKVPNIDQLMGPNDVTTVDLDLDELLGRKPIKLDNSEIDKNLIGKTVLVTGAGGSIGSELVRQIFKAKPGTLVLFDIYENGAYAIQQELAILKRKDASINVNVITLIGSTYDEKTVRNVISEYKPEYIYHAAAYKHVPLMEDSPKEAIRSNVIGTYNVAKAAYDFGVSHMLLVSTDKAVRPTNVMGATKRFAEMIVKHFAKKSKKTIYSAVRFGNVLGSNGSVVPLFKKQIEEGGPITLTNKEITRFFMTIPEAVSLILQTSLYASGGEIFILDMGKPVKIISLAEKIIRQSGYVPYQDIDIVETGLRPGEKLYEELLLDPTTQKKTDNKKIFIENDDDKQPLEEEMSEIVKVFDLKENKDVKKLLASIVKTYSPQ